MADCCLVYGSDINNAQVVINPKYIKEIRKYKNRDYYACCTTLRRTPLRINEEMYKRCIDKIVECTNLICVQEPNFSVDYEFVYRFINPETIMEITENTLIENGVVSIGSHIALSNGEIISGDNTPFFYYRLMSWQFNRG